MKKYGFLFFSLLLFVACSEEENPDFFKIHRGKFIASIVETGELQAVNSRVVVMPNLGWRDRRPKIAWIIDEGSEVKSGDFVLQVDSSNVMKYLREKENELEMALADQRNMLTRHSNEIRQFESQIESAKAELRLAQLQNEKSQFESARNKKVAGLRLENSQLSFKKLERQFATRKKIQENELAIQELKILQLRNEIINSETDIKKTRLFAPIKGIVEYKENWRTGQKIRVGDQVYRRNPLLGIPDLSQMKVLTAVNETDIQKIHMNQKVVVRLDAFPNMPFEGKIIEISRLCHEKRKQPQVKLFDIEILLDESDPVLKPGMTVSCEIVVARLDDAIYISNKAIYKENSHFYIFLQDGGTYKKTQVELGARNSEYSVIQGDFKVGQKVANINLMGEANAI